MRGGDVTTEPSNDSGRRRSKRSDATRLSILDAASREFAQQGYEHTALDAVAIRAGVTKATVYYHFDSKEALYAELLTQYLADAYKRLVELERLGGSPTERLLRLMNSHVDDTLNPSKRYIHYQEFVRTAPGVATSIREAQRRYELAFAAVIRDGQDSGAFRTGDPKIVAMFLIGAVGRTAAWYRPSGPVSASEFRQTIVDLLLKGVITNAEDGSAK